MRTLPRPVPPYKSPSPQPHRDLRAKVMQEQKDQLPPLGGLPPTLIQTCSGKALFLPPKVCFVDSISCW